MMICHLRGRLIYKAPTSAVLDVGGVGYGMSISLSTYDQLPEVGAETQVFTYLYVREDRLELFGFGDEGERELFELLIGVSGIGPHLAQTILSGMSLGTLREAIFHGRVNELTSVKGIGKKTAERLVIELRDKVRLPVPEKEDEKEVEEKSGIVEEAVMALMALGISGATARQAVNKAIEKTGGVQNVQQLIKQALRER